MLTLVSSVNFMLLLSRGKKSESEFSHIMHMCDEGSCEFFPISFFKHDRVNGWIGEQKTSGTENGLGFVWISRYI